MNPDCVIVDANIAFKALVSQRGDLRAHHLCKGVDEQDIPYVALTLHLDGRLWTEDAQLKQGLRARGIGAFFEL